MKRTDATHRVDLAPSDEQTDRVLRRAYEENATAVDVGDFSQALERRLACARRRSRRRAATLKLAIAGAAVIVAAGLGVGTWQAVEHLGGGHPLLVLGDAGEQTPSSTEGSLLQPGQGGAAFSSVEPRSVAALKLADVWSKAAKTLGFDAGTTSLSSINVAWGADGLLDSFVLDATTPDGRAVTLFAAPSPAQEKGETVTFTGSMMHHDSTGLATPLSAGGAVLMTTDQVLAALDSAGLMEIGSQSGVDVAGDAAALWRAETASSDAQGAGSAEQFGAAGPARVLWFLSGSYGDGALLDAEQAATRVRMEAQAAVVLGVSNGGVSRLDVARLPASLFPALGFDITREFLSESGNQGSVGGAQAVVLLHASTPAGTVLGGDTEALPVGGQLNGLAFAASDGRICRIQDGETKTLATVKTDYIGGDHGSYGVSYSLGRHWVLWAGGIFQVTPKGSDAGAPFEVIGGIASNSQGGGEDTSGHSFSTTGSGEAAIMAVPSTGTAASEQLLRTQQLSRMDRFQYDENSDRIWLAEPDANFGEATLWTAQPHTAELQKVMLGSTFGGDFAVSPDGATIFYLGAVTSPAKATLRTGDRETGVTLGLATAYSPVFSPDGAKVCLVGSKNHNGVTSLWLYDVGTGGLTQLTATEGLTPTYPAFSPDGQRIAFRDWRLSDTWTVNVDGGQLTRYALPLGEMPMAW